MIVDAQVTIAAPAATVWGVVTDIAHAAEILRGVEKIELLDLPTHGVVGLKWRETRILFGKPASVEKWITSATEHRQFESRAESDGFVFVTTKQLVEAEGGTILREVHESRPQTFRAKCMTIPMTLFFKGFIRKALLQDLTDIKAAAERHDGR